MTASRRLRWALLCALLLAALPAAALAQARGKRASPAQLVALRRGVWKAIGARSEQQIAKAVMKPVAGSKLSGARAKLLVADEHGRRYMFKPTDLSTTWLDREHFAATLRRAAGEPTVPVVRQKVTLPTGEVLEGYVKPFLANQGELAADPRRWSEAQRAVVMADHVWAELLGNYDTKTDQSIVVAPGVRGGPAAVNIDWDLSLADYVTNRPLTRYKAMNSAPPSYNLLYNAYVHGKVDLDFAALYDAAARAQRIPDAEVRRALAPFLAKAFAGGKTYGPYRAPEDLTRAVLARKANLAGDFERLVSGLEVERADFAGHSGRWGGWRRLALYARDGRMVGMGKLVQSSLFKRAMQVFRKFGGDLPPESSAYTH